MADERPCLGGPGTGLVRVALDKIGKAPDGLDPLSHVAVAVGQHVCHACTKPELVFCAATVYQITARACRGAIVVCHGACGEKLAYVKQISSYHLGRPPPAATINSDLLWVDGDEGDDERCKILLISMSYWCYIGHYILIILPSIVPSWAE